MYSVSKRSLCTLHPEFPFEFIKPILTSLLFSCCHHSHFCSVAIVVPTSEVCATTTLLLTIVYACICRVQNVFLRCPTPRLNCFISSHWPSFRFLSFMAFFIPLVQFFFGLPRALFCFGIHFNAILGSLPSVIL